MTFQQEVNEFMSRIAKAGSERDAWQAVGWQEKYFEAYCAVEALELLLGERMREGAAAQADGGDLDWPSKVIPMVSKASSMKMHCTTTDPRLHDDADDERTLMAHDAIGYDGHRFTYNGYRYDRLADAMAYSKLMRWQPSTLDPGGPFTQREKLDTPTDADRELMTSLAIRFEEVAYRFEGFRYGRLADAVNYATLCSRRGTP